MRDSRNRCTCFIVCTVNLDSVYLTACEYSRAMDIAARRCNMKLKLLVIAACLLLLGTSQVATAQTFNYLSIGTDQFNATVASAFAGTQRPTTYGLPFQ